MQSPSHITGATSAPLLEDLISTLLDHTATAHPELDAIVACEQGIRWTYAELADRVTSMAAGLLGLGLKPGDRVGIWAPNLAEWTLTQFATAKAGLIQVNINPAYRVSELEYTLNKVGVKMLIVAERFKSSDYIAMVEELAPEIAASQLGDLQALKLPHLTAVAKIGGAPRSGWINFANIASGATADTRSLLSRSIGQQRNTDAINIQFTSGTTGLPKGATLSHRNILNNAYFVGLSAGLGRGDRLAIPVPLYHCFGMVMANLACVVHAATMVYPSASFDPLAVLRAVETEKCTVLYGVPTMFIAELAHPEFERFDLSSLRGGIMAGSPCPIEVMRRVIDKMHMRDVTIAYGMTETSPVSFQSAPDDPMERRVTTVGRIQPHMEAKIVDAAGRILPRDEAGEICTRGYAVMLGYWEDEERTREAIDAEGWMHTGDLGTIDAEGYCNIVGRLKDMIIRGGENIYPREVEEFLFKHPAVEDVAVIGLPDDKFGEEVCAWIKLRPGHSVIDVDIREFCQGQIAHYKIPRYIEFVDGFPTTVTGKVQKFLIREQMMQRFGLSARPTA